MDSTKNTYSDSNIQRYLEDINKIPLLSREEEDKLARLAVKGDKEAKNKLIVANLRFVVKVAKKYRKYGISLLDLINEGNLGLIKAADKFDPEKGFHFITYAVWWVRQSISMAVHQKTALIRLPMNRTVDLEKINRIEQDLRKQTGKDPTLSEVANRLNIKEDEIQWLKNISEDLISLDAPINDKSNYSKGDNVKDENYIPEDELMSKVLKEKLNLILDELTVNERKIIELRFGLTKKYPEILSLSKVSKKLKLSKERVRQIEKKTLLKLYQYAQKHQLDVFLKQQ